jgi:hypothetical protein
LKVPDVKVLTFLFSVEECGEAEDDFAAPKDESLVEEEQLVAPSHLDPGHLHPGLLQPGLWSQGLDVSNHQPQGQPEAGSSPLPLSPQAGQLVLMMLVSLNGYASQLVPSILVCLC